jgi:hypothetical protein
MHGVTSPAEPRSVCGRLERYRVSMRELRRQFDAGFYEPLALSRDTQGDPIRDLTRQGQHVARP